MLGRIRLGFIIWICLILFIPLHASAGPARPDLDCKNEALSRDLSSKLSSRVVVYEIDQFLLVTSASYNSKIRDTVIPNLREALGEFRNLFSIDSDAGLWSGQEKGRLVLLKNKKTFRKYVSIFEKEVNPDRLSPGFAESVQDAQSFYWIEPVPYAVCCGQGTGFREINQHLFHLLGHILLTIHEYNYKFAPAWLHEGFGAYLAVRYADGNILYCTQGLNNARFGTGVFKNLSAWARSENWPQFLKQRKKRDRLISLDSLSHKPLQDFDHCDAALSWSFTTFLIDQYPEKFRAYVYALKKTSHSLAPDSNWLPVEIANKTFVDVFKVSFEEIEVYWKDWVMRGELASKDRNRATKPTATDNRMRFDPALHLEDFTIFEGDRRAEPYLAPFHRRTGEWVAPRDLEAIRASWEEARQKLVAAMAMWSREKLPGMNDFIEELAASTSVSPMSDDEILKLIQPPLVPELCRPAIRYLAEEYGCYGAYKRLQCRIEDVADDIPGSGVEDDFQLLETAALAEADLFNGLAAKKACVSVGFFPSKMKVLSANDGELVLCAKKADREEFFDIEAFEDLDVQEKGSTVRIRCSWSCISLKNLLLLGKNKLKRKSANDRYLYCLLCLFRGDETDFRKEFKFIRNSAVEVEGDELETLMVEYGRSKKGSAFLKLLASPRDADNETRINHLLSAVVATKGTGLYDLHEYRATEVLRLLLCKEYASGRRILPTLRGYQGTEDDGETAHFLIEFDEGEDLDGFDCRFPCCLSGLNRRFSVDPNIEQKPFHIDDGSLTCRGLGFAALEQIFTGDLESTVHIKVEMMSEDANDKPYYLLFGYGLDQYGAFIAANGTTHLDIQSRNRSVCQHLEISSKEEKLDGEKGITLTLRGTADNIVHIFNDREEYTANTNGQRTGRIFLWTYGPVTFRVEKLEVKAKLDPSWLKRSVELAVADDLKRLLDFSPDTVGKIPGR